MPTSFCDRINTNSKEFKVVKIHEEVHEIRSRQTITIIMNMSTLEAVVGASGHKVKDRNILDDFETAASSTRCKETKVSVGKYNVYMAPLWSIYHVNLQTLVQ